MDVGDEGLEVLDEFHVGERELADDAVDVAAVVIAILLLAVRVFLHRVDHVWSNGASLRRGHETLRTEDLTELRNDAHHVGACDRDVEVHPAALDLRDEVVRTSFNGARSLRCSNLVRLAEADDASRLTGAVRKTDRTTEDLISLLRVDTEVHHDVDRLIELRRLELAESRDRFRGREHGFNRAREICLATL